MPASITDFDEFVKGKEGQTLAGFINLLLRVSKSWRVVSSLWNRLSRSHATTYPDLDTLDEYYYKTNTLGRHHTYPANREDQGSSCRSPEQPATTKTLYTLRISLNYINPHLLLAPP
jgi:hypothetical protein